MLRFIHSGGLRLVAAGLGVCVLCSCAGKDQKIERPNQLADETQVRSIDRIMAAQASAGAAQDATLLPSHFDGEHLNSLGTGKLYLMVQGHGAGSQPMVVYLDMPEGSVAQARRSAVEKHLKDTAPELAKVQVQLGANPAGGAYAAPIIARQNKTESTADQRDQPQSQPQAGNASQSR